MTRSEHTGPFDSDGVRNDACVMRMVRKPKNIEIKHFTCVTCSERPGPFDFEGFEAIQSHWITHCCGMT